MATFQEGCVFCKIVKGESPSDSIYEVTLNKYINVYKYINN